MNERPKAPITGVRLHGLQSVVHLGLELLRAIGLLYKLLVP